MDIFGAQKLEEQIATTKDPETRKQLEELLDKRKKKANEIMWAVLIFFAILIVGLFISKAIEMQGEHTRTMRQIEHEKKMLDMQR